MNTNAMITTATKEATDAAWRTAASTALSTVKKPILAAMKKNGASDESCQTTLAFLETDAGEAIFAIVLGSILSGVPLNNPKLNRLASELRILGFQNITDQFAEVFASCLGGLAASLPEV